MRAGDAVALSRSQGTENRFVTRTYGIIALGERRVGVQIAAEMTRASWACRSNREVRLTGLAFGVTKLLGIERRLEATEVHGHASALGTVHGHDDVLAAPVRPGALGGDI
jgi:hypothetical protein